MSQKHFLAGHIGKWQGRQRPSSMEFQSRRPCSPASTWAWQLGNPVPLYALGVNNEAELRDGVAQMRQFSATRKRLDDSKGPGLLTAQRPLSAMSTTTSDRPQSPNMDSSFRSATPQYDTLRPDTQKASDFSVLGYGRPHSATPKLRDSQMERPAGVSRTPAGQQLGLNVSVPSHTPVPRPASALSETKAISEQQMRFTNPLPTYLLQLDRNKANPGCTKHVPGRRFVDFISRSQGALLAEGMRTREIDRTRGPYFSATSRSVPPPDEPYRLRKAYGGGTCYTEFNRSCMTGHAVSM